MPLAVEFTTIAEMFDRLTLKFSDASRPVLKYKSGGAYRAMTYSELRTHVEHAAAGLTAIGIARGDHVALISENRPEWVIADMALVRIGAINVSIYPTLTAKQIEFILNDAGVKLAIVSNQAQLMKLQQILATTPTLQRIVVMSDRGVVADGERVVLLTRVSELGRESAGIRVLEPTARPQDLLTLIYTSGTTGNPKGVMLTHDNLVSNIKASAECIPISTQDIALSYLPLCHSFERMAGYYTALACGATVAYAENIDTIRDNLVEIQPTFMTTVPRLFERIYNRLMKQIDASPPMRQKIFHWAIRVGKEFAVARRRNTVSPLLAMKRWIADRLVFRKIRARTGGRMRYFVSGGAALSRELGEFFEATGLIILEGYGMTESSPVISVNRIDSYKFGTVGLPIPGVEVRIADDGEIIVRGPNVTRGYWQNPEATAESIDREGWLHTGDIGRIDDDGYLVITDRKKHLFVSSGGKNIAPQPIESLFLQSKYIDQFVLIGDGRMFLSALVVPDFESVGALLRARGVSEHKDLASHPEVNSIIEEEIGRLQKELAPFERVRKFAILDHTLTVEAGEITPTLKVKRKVVEEKYRALIERMYEGVR
jgi:long-chain acyl-CoA synthetase